MRAIAPDAGSPGQAERDFSQVDKHRLLAALARVLPPACLLHDPEDLRPYECDGMAALRQLPLLVALPETEAQVVEILRICFAQGVPVVARGAGTGLSGGAQPHRFGLVLSLARFKKILQIDAHARRAVVQPGVRNLAISEAAAPHGLYYAPDPSSQIACTIGGNVAENSGGVHCLKYGLTLHNLLKVRGVTMAGEVVEFGSLALDAPGYDLLPLVTGSEGMLALVTEVTVRLTPKPQLAQCVLAAFDDVVKAGDAVAAIIAAGIIPAGLEMMDQPATAAVEEFVHAGYPLDAQAILLCEADGTPEEVAEEIARVRALLEAGGATEVRVSRDEAERLRFWAGRKAAFPAVGRITLIDLDMVAESNVNRQVHALGDEFGKAKTRAMAERILAINPACMIEEIEDFVTPDNLDDVLGRGFDLVIDAIDQVRTKAAMIAWCKRHGVPIVTAGGAGGQIDPTRIEVADLAHTIQDPLLSKVRSTLRKEYPNEGFTRDLKKKFGIPAVFSSEPLRYPENGASCDEPPTLAGLNCAGYGSSVCVTAPFGLLAASVALRQLAGL